MESTQSYKQKLLDTLACKKNYKTFIRAVTSELSTYGLSQWAYCPLDVPAELAARELQGTINPDFKKRYIQEQLYNSDLLIRQVSITNEPVFQSDIDNFLDNGLNVAGDIARSKQLSDIKKTLGYKDTYGLSVGSKKEGDRALFSVTTTNLSSEIFKMQVLSIKEDLATLGNAINQSGINNFPERFINSKLLLKKFYLSQPFNLLTTMVKYDLTVSEVAQRFNVRPDTAKKQLLKARNTLGAKTYATAFVNSVKKGIIDLDCNYIPLQGSTIKTDDAFEVTVSPPAGQHPLPDTDTGTL